jgi:hypothetical protein
MDHLNTEEKKLLHEIKNKGMEDAEAAKAAKAEDNGRSENSERELEEQQQPTHNGIF